MLVSSKWQAMWLESQHCSKSIVNVPLSSLQTQKLLEDLRTNCSSTNKAVQLEALKCWEVWIKNQNPDDWKLNTVCFTAVRPLITKKLQPLQKDIDICKTKLSLMWALLLKVQNVMQLEGPQYILEVCLQSCLTWLNSISEDGTENEISVLIFQLLLAIFKKDETVCGWDRETFPSFSVNILSSKKVFPRLADKFLNIFTHWKKAQEKNVLLKLWKYFLEFCELSCEQIPIPVWHKIFKLASQICSEKTEPLKQRLAFLHSCATALKSVLTSSKFIDFGNLLTTPCEAFLKKLVELCMTESNESYDSEMFLHSKEICQVLSDKSVTIGGFDLCISVLDVLEEFWLRSLFWGVWCGLVHCYKIRLSNQDKSLFTRAQMKFYRKLRGVAVNFELDRNHLHKDCLNEVKKHIDLLSITCMCTSYSIPDVKRTDDFISNKTTLGVESNNGDPLHLNPSTLGVSVTDDISNKVVEVTPRLTWGAYSSVVLRSRPKLTPRKTVSVNVDLIKNILQAVGVKLPKVLFNGLFDFRLFTFQVTHADPKIRPGDSPLQLKVKMNNKKEANLIVSSIKRKSPPAICDSSHIQKDAVVLHERNPKEKNDEIITSRRTRSKIKAEEEKKREIENQKRKRRKSFEVLVQEIVRKNKERKTEKNSQRRKSPVALKNRQKNKKEKTDNRVNKKSKILPERRVKNHKKEDAKTNKKKAGKADGKLENYFKVITKKAGNQAKKEEKKTQKVKKDKAKAKESTCCNLMKDENNRKGETGWRQTSLKTMMNRKRKAEKGRQGGRSRNKTNVADEKIKETNKSVTGSPLAKLSPFKEVFHDHEYTKIEFQNLQTYERLLLAKNAVEADDPNEPRTFKLKPLNLEKDEFLGTGIFPKTGEFDCPKNNVDCSGVVEGNSLKNPPQSGPGTPEKVNLEESAKSVSVDEVTTEVRKTEVVISQTEPDRCDGEPKPEILEPNRPDVLENPDDDSVLTCGRKGKKRVRMLDSLKPSKKIKLEEEETDDLPEVTEKENLEENQPEMISSGRKDKMGNSILRNDGSPKTTNGGAISSRALRMIALVPESTKGGQMQWESPSRVEVLKCKKAPNVDKNSRASKMLALLSENIVEPEEAEEVKVDEVISCKLAVTPNGKTPASSLKSPKSVRKRRSIRFDDAKNETVLYQTDTPPSQILEEKEKCRRIKAAEIIISLL